jgi:parallel beta-helix repeat protein
MSRKLVSVVFFALLLIGFLNSAKIQPVEVDVRSGYEVNLEKAALFLNSTQFDSAVGLCREAPNVHNNTFWLVSDNLLAYHALKYYYPETAEAIYATMLSYGYFRSFKHEVVFGTTTPYIPFKKNNTYILAQIGTKLIETEVCNGSSMDDYKEYADLCIYAALHFYWSGNISQAIDYFNIAKNMWNSTLHGIYDNASKDAEKKGERLVFSTYKLALLLYCSRILGQPFEERTSIEETLWLMQDGEYGGLHTDYDISLNYTGSDMNTETTSLAILSYKYEPKIANRPAKHQVSLSIPPDYQKIQEAINNANEKDTIFVFNGTYYEHIVVNKSLSLIGQNRCNTTVDGNFTGDVIEIVANKVNITGINIQNSGAMPYCGILLYNSTNDNLYDNQITANNNIAICLSHSSNNNITANNIANNGVGISLEWSSNNTLQGNIITASNFEGIWLDYSSNNRIYGNTVTVTRFHCLGLYESPNNTVAENTLSNSYIGIELFNSTNNGVLSNTLLESNYGIWLHSSSNTKFYHNNFVNNTYQVYDYSWNWPVLPSTNTWDDGVEGNYWSNYNCSDSDYDGLGDAPCFIDANNKDNYPLMGMFHSFNTSLDLPINVISNSTIENFEYFESNSTIIMHVSSMTSNQTFGFIRICIPYALMNETYHVTIDGAEPYYVNYTLYDNGTHRWIYFSYQHSTLEIIIVPEFPSFLILPVFMAATLLAVVVYKRKKEKG